MKFTKLSLTIFSLLLSSSSVCLTSMLVDPLEKADSSAPQSLLFKEALERNYLPFDQHAFTRLYMQGIKAQKSNNFEAAQTHFSQAAQYGDIRAFKGIAECYAGLNDWVMAFKWMGWAVQEGYLQQKMQTKVVTECLTFLNVPQNRQNLISKLGNRKTKRWNPDYATIQWGKEVGKLAILEPYLEPDEIAAKKVLLEYADIALDIQNLKQNMYQIWSSFQNDDSKTENFFSQLKKLNTPVSWIIISIKHFQEGNFIEAYPWTRKFFEWGGGLKSLISKKPDNHISLEQLKNSAENLAQIYENVDPNNLLATPDYQKAYELYKVLADQYGTDLGCQNLGVLYEHGRGCEKNPVLAFKYMTKSHTLNPTGVTFYNLGAYYLNGTGTAVNYEAAKDYFEKAVQLGNYDACVSIGTIYLRGLGVTPSLQKACEFYSIASLAGDERAQLELMDIHAAVIRQEVVDYEEGKEFSQEIKAQIKIFQNYVEIAKDPKNSKGALALSTLYFYVNNEVEKALKLLEEGIEFKKASDVEKMQFLRWIQNLIHMYLDSRTKSFLLPENIDTQVQKWEQERDNLFSEEEKGTKFYFKSLTAVKKKEYIAALEHLNQATLWGYKDTFNLFADIQSLLKKEKKEKEAASKKQKEVHKAQKNEERQRRQQAKVQAKVEEILLSGKSLQSSIVAPRELEVTFENKEVEAQYLELLKTDDSKLAECVNALKQGNTWETKGPGKPEVLKGRYQGYKGIISRRLDDFNRLTYVVTAPGQIHVLSCTGHYQDKKRK